MEKNILVNDFVKKYKEMKSEEAKLAYVKSVMKRTYCPILEKKAVLEKMVEISKGEGDVAYLDMVLSKLNFTMAIIVLYTHLVVSKDENGKPEAGKAYDMLVQADLLNVICSIIGEREMNELISINEAAIGTWHNKNTSIEAYVASLTEKAVDRFGVVAGAGAQQLAAILDDEKKVEKVLKLVEKAAKKVK